MPNVKLSTFTTSVWIYFDKNALKQKKNFCYLEWTKQGLNIYLPSHEHTTVKGGYTTSSACVLSPVGRERAGAGPRGRPRDAVMPVSLLHTWHHLSSLASGCAWWCVSHVSFFLDNTKEHIYIHTQHPNHIEIGSLAVARSYVEFDWHSYKLKYKKSFPLILTKPYVICPVKVLTTILGDASS